MYAPLSCEGPRLKVIAILFKFSGSTVLSLENAHSSLPELSKKCFPLLRNLILEMP